MSKLLKKAVALIAAACLAVSMFVIGAFGATGTQDDPFVYEASSSSLSSGNAFCDFLDDKITVSNQKDNYRYKEVGADSWLEVQHRSLSDDDVSLSAGKTYVVQRSYRTGLFSSAWSDSAIYVRVAVLNPVVLGNNLVINFNEFTDSADWITSIKNLVVEVDGSDPSGYRDSLVVKYNAGNYTDNWQELTYDSYLYHSFGEDSRTSEVVRVYWGEYYAEATVELKDLRPATAIETSSPVTVEHADYSAWTSENWRANLIDRMGAVVKAEGAALDVDVKLLDGASGAELTSLPAVGTHNVIVEFAGNKDYKAAQSVSVSLTMTDGRVPAVVSAHDAEIVVSDISRIQDFATEEAILSQVGAATTAGEDVKCSIAVLDKNGNEVALPISALGEYKAVVSSPETETHLPAYSEQIVLKLVDGRLGTQLLGKESVRINYIGEQITSSEIIAAVFDKVVAGNDVVTTDPSDVAIKSEAIVGATVYQKIGETFVPLFKTTIGGSGVEILDVAGTYRVTLVFAETDTHLSSSAAVEFEVDDYRLETEITLSAGKLEMPTLDTRFTEQQVLDALEFAVKDENGQVISTSAEDVTVSITGLTGLAGDASIITEAGTYVVSVTYDNNESYKGSYNLLGSLTVSDTRLETAMVVEDASTESADLSVIAYDHADILTKMSPVVLVNSETLGDAEVVISSIKISDAALGAASITEPGEYVVEFEFAGDNYNKPCKGEAIFKVIDARPQPVITLKADQLIPYSASNPVTEEGVFYAVFDGVTVVEGYGYSDSNVVIKNGSGVEVDIAEAAEVGSYTITVMVPATDTSKAASSTVGFTISDGRNVTKVNLVHSLDEDAVVAYDFSDGLGYDEVVDALLISVVDTETGEVVDPADYTVSFTRGGEAVDPSVMAVGDVCVMSVIFEGNGDQAPCSVTIPFAVSDLRFEAVLSLNADASIAYKAEGYADQEIFDLLFGSLVDEAGNSIAAELTAEAALELAPEKGFLTIEAPVVEGVGTYEATVAFSGDWNNKPATATIEFEVVKGETSVNVESQTVTYSDEGYRTDDFIAVNPVAEHITFVVGLTLGENASADAGLDAYINIPGLFDLDSLPTWIPDAIVEPLKSYLDSLANGTGMSVSDLRSTLQGIADAIAAINEYGEWLGIDISTEAIDTIISVLEQIEDLEGVGNLTVYLSTYEDGITLKDSGVYVTGAVTTDANYETAFGLGYLVVKPAMTKVDLAFNIEDENGFVTYALAQSGEYDLGTHVIPGNLTDDQLAAANAQVQNLFVGVDLNGEPVIVDSQTELTIGAYAQLGYILDLGNEMFYAEPIARAFAVVTDLAIVEFENGEQQQFTYTGKPQGMTAVAVNRAGEALPSENISYRYLGVEGDFEFYDSAEAPANAGVYTVIATYLDAELKHAGMAIGMMTIAPAEAAVEVSDLYYVYDGEKVDAASMVAADPADAEIALISAGIDVSGDFSENGLDAVKGVVNVDFPAYIDEVLKPALPSLYADGVTASDFAAKLASAKDKLAEIGIDGSYVDELVATIQEMPNATTLTFKEQAEVAPVAPGAYVVIAVVMDPNYKVAADMGVLVIAPEIIQAQLEWDYDDSNGIFTTPLLEQNPAILGATPYDAEGAVVEAQVSYLYIGVDENGAYVTTADANELSLGVYTQIAFIGEGISAHIKIAEPIMRTIVVAPQLADVQFVDGQGENDERIFVYTGEPQSMPAKAFDLAGTELTAGTFSYLYAGVEGDVENYLSSEAPTEVGAYTVTAVYVERDAEGTPAYVGATVGAMVIAPAEGKYELADTTVVHNGEGQWVEVANESGLPYEVSVVVDEDHNVNVIAPEGWIVEGRVIGDVEGLIEVLTAEIESMASVAKNPAYKAALEKFAAALRAADIKSVEIDGEKPSEAGVYKIHTLAFGDTNYAPAYASAVLTIEHQWAEELSSDEAGHWNACEVEGCEAQNEFAEHDAVSDEAVAAGCESEGLTEGSHCETCEYVIVEQEVVPATGHEKTTLVDALDAGCVKTGYTGDEVCDACGETVKQGEVVPAFNHTEVEIPGRAATCTEDGLTVGIECETCGETLVEQEVIPTAGHTMGKWRVVDDATCTEDGLEQRDCDACDHFETNVLAALGHTEVADAEVAATCTDPGLTAGSHCDVCGETLVAQEVVSALGHTEVEVAGKDATCTEDGLTAGIECETCGETLVEQVAIAATGHEKTTLAGALEADCENAGYTGDEVCDKCGETVKQGEVIPALGHAMGEWHVVDDAACTEDGLEQRDCDACDHFETNVLAALGHTEETVLVGYKAATETEDGYTGDETCKRCGNIVKKGEIIPATGVTPDPEPVWHNVVLMDGEGYSISAEGLTDGKVKEGEGFEFIVKADAGYDIVEVLVNGEPVKAASDGSYAVENVDGPVVVQVKTAVKLYEVSLEGENCTITPAGLEGGKVAHGGSFSFAVTPAEGYQVDKVLVDGKAVEAEGGVYRVEGVTGPVAVKVETSKVETPVEPDPEPVWFDVLVLAENCKVEIEGLTDGKVKEGEGFAFTVKADEGYEAPVVTINGQPAVAVDGKYTVENVSETVIIEAKASKIETPVVPPVDPDPEPISIEDAVIAGLEDRVYTSKALIAELSVTLGDKVLVEGTDYTVAYTANVEVGTATATVTGIGNYTGTATVEFEIAHYATVGLFTDFEAGSWYLDETQGAFAGLRTLYMDYALATGLMSGYKNADGSMTTFGPWDSLDRAQAATIIYRMAVEDASATVDPAKYANNATDLSDVENGKYYTAAVNWCVENGVITGYLGGPDDGKYKPYKKVTRQELAIMIQRYCVNVCGVEDARADVSGYSDSGKIADWALPGLEFCKAQGVMSGVYGTDKLNPAGNANRAEAAKMFSVVGHDIL